MALEKKDILNGKLVDALHAVLDDKRLDYLAKINMMPFSFRKNSERLSAMIKAKPMSPDDKLIKYVEFAAKFGNDNNLDMYGRHLGVVEFYCLDIIIPFLVAALLVLYILYRLVKFMIRKVLALCFGGNKAKKD